MILSTWRTISRTAIRCFRRINCESKAIHAWVPVYVIKSVWDFVDDFHSVFFGQCHHSFVPPHAVGLRVVLIGQLGYFPLVEQRGEHILRLSSHDKEPEGVQHTTNLQHHNVYMITAARHQSYNWRQDLKMAIRIVFPNAVPARLPGVELPEAAVQVFEGSNEEPPAVDANTGVVVEVWVQDEDRVELLTVPQSSHQRWVVMQPESLAEPVNTCVSHAGEIWEHITDISSDL